MKRSVINETIASAKDIAQRNRRVLPVWSDWSVDDYRKDPEVTQFLYDRQMGWDITDFGGGSFEERGLVLFCLRNGIQGSAYERPYAEKMLVVEERQETPFHFHKIKLEDIINCAGGNLMIEFLDAADADTPIIVRADGQAIKLRPREPLRLKPGQSVTVERGVYHRFYGEAGHGPVLAWEVSQVNDDHSDNYFLDELGRFSTIEDDTSPVNPLWHELQPYLPV